MGPPRLDERLKSSFDWQRGAEVVPHSLVIICGALHSRTPWLHHGIQEGLPDGDACGTTSNGVAVIA